MATLLLRWICTDLTADEPRGSEPANFRRYRAGPLAADDFRGQVPALRDQSWNLSPQNARLMDHEQGHFDLSHSFALAVQLYLDEHLKSRRLPVGTGTSSSAATRSLEDQLRAELKPILDEHAKAQTEYDRVTSHGAMTAAQAEQRKLQLAKIAELDDKLAAPKKKSRK